MDLLNQHTKDVNDKVNDREIQPVLLCKITGCYNPFGDAPVVFIKMKLAIKIDLEILQLHHKRQFNRNYDVLMRKVVVLRMLTEWLSIHIHFPLGGFVSGS